MEDVYYTPEDFDANNIFSSIDNVKPDRTPLDLLFQVMPELNIELSAKIEEKEVIGKRYSSLMIPILSPPSIWM